MEVKELDKKLLDTFKVDEPTIQELRNIAKNLGIKLKRNMNKKEILKAVRKEIKRIEESSNQRVEKVSDYTKLAKNLQNLQKLPKSNESKNLSDPFEKSNFLKPISFSLKYFSTSPSS